MKLLPGADLQLLRETELISVREFSPLAHIPDLDVYVAQHRDAPGVRFMDGDFCFGTAVISQNFLLHVGVLPEYQGRLFRLLPEVLRWCFTVNDQIYAVMRPENKKVLTFAQRFGWLHLPLASARTVDLPGGPFEIYVLRADVPRIPLTSAERRLHRQQQREIAMRQTKPSEASLESA